MDDYRFLQRRRKRGQNCLVGPCLVHGAWWGTICGCGSRTPPGKKHKKRIIRRALKRQLQEG